MIVLVPITVESVAYEFVQQLLCDAFPPNEQRRPAQQRVVAATCSNFHIYGIAHQRQLVGLLNYWDFDSYAYVEHFAILPTLRNQGIGSETLRLFIQHVAKPVILEVEFPTSRRAAQRIEFYKRLGFRLRRMRYMQPPYNPGDSPFPMELMTYGEIDLHTATEQIAREVYAAFRE